MAWRYGGNRLLKPPLLGPNGNLQARPHRANRLKICWYLGNWKMARQETIQERRERKREAKRQHDDRQASIDAQMAEAFKAINWRRRNRASKSLVAFVKTYMIGLLIDDAPEEMYIKALEEMEAALSQARPYNIELPRGSGKTSAAQMAVIYLLATGRRKFAVVVSANHAQSQNIIRDIFRAVIEEGPFSVDYPELALPFQLLEGSYRRRQLYKGVCTNVSKTASQITFARLKDEDGKEMPTSQSTIVCKGVTSGVRGLKCGKLRPDLVLLDDLQSHESAESAEQVQKLLDIIKCDIMNLSGKGKMNLLMTSTPVAADDLTCAIEADPNWKTTKYKAVLSWPKDIRDNPDNGLWAQYFKLFDAENAQDKPHDGSRAFYRKNRKAMDDGAVLFAPHRYKPNEHLSALQALLEVRHTIGNAAFSVEHLLTVVRYSFALDIQPKNVLAKMIDIPALVIPEGTVLTVASSDLNVSYAISTSVVAFDRDMTAHVVWHEITKCRIDSKLPETEYNNAVIRALTGVGQHLAGLGISIDAWGIDGSGIPFNAVTRFAKTSAKVCGIRACAMIGRANHMFNPYVRSRLRDALNDTVLAGDPQEHVQSGAGAKYIIWNADKWRSTAQKAILAPYPTQGGLTLYKADADEHVEFANQVCNERLKYIQHKADGRDIYHWNTNEPHDLLDTLGQAFAVCASQGIGGGEIKGPTKGRTAIQKRRLMHRPKIRIV